MQRSRYRRRMGSLMSAKAKRKKMTMAEQADIHELYEESVQNVDHEVEFVQQTFENIRGRKAYLLREDFCGTASAACEWAKQGEAFQSIGVDLDPSVLERGRENRVGRLHNLMRCLERDDLRIIALSIDDSVDCAVVRLMFDNFERARELLQLGGYSFIETDIIGVELPEAPQPFLAVCSTLLQSEINISYTCLLYTSPSPRDRG